MSILHQLSSSAFPIDQREVRGFYQHLIPVDQRPRTAVFIRKALIAGRRNLKKLKPRVTFSAWRRSNG